MLRLVDSCPPEVSTRLANLLGDAAHPYFNLLQPGGSRQATFSCHGGYLG